MGKTISFPNGDAYNGELNLDSIPHGNGRVIYNDKFVYEGTFKNGQAWYGGRVFDSQGAALQGHHKQRYLNLGIYEGNYVNGERSGQAKVVLDSGDVFEGQFQNDKAEGVGTWISSNGDQFEAEHKNDLKSGYFVKKFANGDLLEGTCVDDQLEGAFLFAKHSGEVSEMVYVNNQVVSERCIGSAEIVEFDARRPPYFQLKKALDDAREHAVMKVEAVKQQKILCCRNCVSYPNGDQYIGEVKDQKPDGQGCVTYNDQFTFRGPFKNGKASYGGYVCDQFGVKLTGIHQQRYLNESVYEGKFVNGQRCGQGTTVLDENGDVFVGQFLDDMAEGLGRWTLDGDYNDADYVRDLRNGYYYKKFHSGEILEGNCKDNKFNGMFLYTKPGGEMFEAISARDAQGIARFIIRFPAGPAELQAAAVRRGDTFERWERIRRSIKLISEFKQLKVRNLNLKPVLDQDKAENGLKISELQVAEIAFSRVVAAFLHMVETGK